MKIQRVINGTYEEEVALIDIETNELLLKGDAYHDKIDKQIEGFLLGLLYCNFKHSLLEDKTITPTDKLFDICEFSNEDYDDDEEDCEILEDIKGDEVLEYILKERHPHLINHRFEIDTIDGEVVFFGGIIEALEKTKDYEGDLFIAEGNRYSIVYSCQGLELEDNNNCLKEFGVYYDEDNNVLHIIKED